MRLLSFIGVDFHWDILQYVLGLPFMTFLALLLYLRSRDEDWMRLARTLAKGFILVFAVGAATGTASEFGLVLLWPNLTEAAGRYIYFPLYMEIFAFMMEVIFLYMLWYGWNRISPKALAVVAFFGFLGAWYSASMIISVNSFMVAPTGILPAYEPDGTYLYSQGYPKLAIYLPKDVAKLLDIKKLAAAGVEVLGDAGDSYKVAIPVRVVQQLVREAFTGVALKDSILVKGGFVNVKAVEQLSPEQLRQLAEHLGLPSSNLLASGSDPVKTLLQVPVFNVLDYIVMTTVRRVGYMSITFKSPVYLASIAHTLGAGLTVSGFTVMAAYALRLLRMPENADPRYRRYVEKAFKFATIFTLIAIVYQGFIAGHLMGEAVAEYNPEKFAAMEGTSQHILSLSRLLGTDKIMPLIAYGSMNAKLPDYDKIPRDYCICKLANTPPVQDCRPPIMIHYIYYAKVGLGILLGLYAALMTLVVLRDRWGFADALLNILRIRGKYPRTLLASAIVAAAVAQLVSTMGWVVREVGRKPWSIYGMMTVDVAGTANPPPAWELGLVAAYFLIMLGALVYAVYRILWLPGKPEKFTA
ncbi:cytochrome ubiquinol oxidase subunit I [Pyrodictium occultum]|nr:cytochrome ubiquinol oxidase subunit I [Pyrodictium occultum]